jgi:2-aminophenol/2-amino-5-chlorophenol 1,6-dioxygenase alpha subunit
MPLVAALLVPGSPLHFLRRDIAPWRALVAAHATAAAALAAARPDVLLVYSTQWIAVLDELWQTRPRVAGLHVDENWYELGDLPYDLSIDTALAAACITATSALGIRSKGVDYDGFPIDTGTIVANGFVNPDGRFPLVIAANNVYHDWATTSRLGALAAAEAKKLGRRYAVLGIGGLSGTLFRTEIPFADDRIADPANARLDQDLLDALARDDRAPSADFIADYAARAHADMGMKHLAWILGALDGGYAGADVLAYGPAYGGGAAVVQFHPSTQRR